MNALPPESALGRDAGWDANTEITAALLERVDFWARQFAVFKGVKPGKLPKPIEVNRPGEQVQRGNVITDPSELAGFFAKHSG